MTSVSAKTTDPNRLLTPEEVAARLCVHLKTLARWRTASDGPRYIKLAHNLVRYRETDLAEFLAARSRRHTGDASQ